MFVKLLVALLSFYSTSVNAWGSIGHIAVAKIAQNNLTDFATKSISNIIPDGDMGLVANWADQIRNMPEWHWTEPLHFIDTNDWMCNYVRERDCYNMLGNFEYCVDGAIQNYTSLLKNTEHNGLTNNNDEYLKFIIHFVGDIHQPLHCGFKTDRGGNSIHIHFNNHSTNLHALWDSGLISKRINDDFNNDYNEWIKYLLQNTPHYNLTDDCIGCSQLWGNTSAKLSCEYAYVHEDGITHIKSGDYLNDEYYKRNIIVIEKQIIYAGYRLSNLLNYLYNDN
jgi:hypothetical protein